MGNAKAKELDLTAIPAEAAPEEGLSRPATQPYNPEPEREKIRGQVALWLVFLLVAVVAASFALLLLPGTEFGNLKALVELVLLPVIALVGSVTGFYFGANSKR